jgi:hypothetical protein
VLVGSEVERCLFMPAELVWSQTLRESRGWPKTTPVTPAAYPAAALFQVSTVEESLIFGCIGWGLIKINAISNEWVQCP